MLLFDPLEDDYFKGCSALTLTLSQEGQATKACLYGTWLLTK